MAKPFRSTLFWGVFAGAMTLLVAVGLGLEACRRNPRISPNVAGDVLAGTPDLARLERLKWSEVLPTAEGWCADAAHARDVLAATVATRHPPTLYLRGLLILAQGDRPGALATFQAVPIDVVPESYLYAPYRLQIELQPDAPNSFRAPLVRAAAQGRLPSLLEARVLAREAHPKQALNGYLRSDPSQWTDYDLNLFPFLLNHAGLERETRAVLRGALRGGRVHPELRTQLETLATGAPEPSTPTAVQNRLAPLLQGTPESRALAGQVAIQHLEIRRQFLQKHYAQLLGQHTHADPAAQADETVLLLTLSAARQADARALDRWSQEIKRRFPEPEVEQWIKNLRLAAK